jgi:hypothetical protein
VGGAERVAITLANSLTERGWDVQFVVKHLMDHGNIDSRADVLVLGDVLLLPPLGCGAIYVGINQSDNFIYDWVQYHAL